MKCFGLALLLLATAGISFAQNPTPVENPGIEVLKLSWNKERIGWQNDPFRGPIENFDEMRARTRNERRITEAKRGGGGSADKIKADAKADAANIATQHQVTPSQYVFTYKATIKNTGNKTIKLVDWDYVFYDRSTNTEMGRRQFTNEEKIGPGKSRELVASLTKPPSHTISVTSIGKNESQTLEGRIVIVRVEYSDGTYWQVTPTEGSNP